MEQYKVKPFSLPAKQKHNINLHTIQLFHKFDKNLNMTKLERALQQSIVGFLKDRGIEPARVSGNNYYYYSPFKSENDPSFCVNVSKYDKEMFKEFNTGNKMGDIVDLVCKLHNVDVSEAISIILEGEVRNVKFKPAKKKGPGIIVEEDGEITKSFLLDYMCIERKIKEDVLQRFCKQVKVKFPYGSKPERTHYAVGFKNTSGGWEIRSTYLKQSSSPKNITKIEGNPERNLLFEGFINFLSFVSHRETYNSYVLNGLCNFPYLNEETFYDLYIDNDKPADEALLNSNIRYEDKRHEFYGYGDYNEAYCDGFWKTKTRGSRDIIRKICVGGW